jgi:type IV pilus assembly protein PilE
MAPAQKGFTLLEVMITVAIVAVLAAIAVPNYRTYVTRGRIVEASSALSDARVKMEQYYQDNRSYPASCTTGVPGPTQIQVMAAQNFDLACSNLTATTYTVTANGKGAVAGFTYTIAQDNSKTSAFRGGGASAGWTAAAPNNCCLFNKGGVC